MNTLKTFFIVLLIHSLTGVVFAQADILTQSQQEQLLERLAQLEEVANQVRNSVYSKALADLNEAVGHPSRSAELFVECVNEVDFKAQNKKFGGFQEWKKKHLKTIRDSDHEKALQLQVRYLIMTMNLVRVKEWADVQGLIAKVLEYLDQVAAAEPARGFNNRPVLNASLNQSYFVKRYKLEKSLTPQWGWVMNPGNLPGIYDKFILPNIIKHGNKDLLDQVWLRRVKQEQVIADKKNKADEFKQFGLPALEWKKANNIYAMGMRRQAFLKMLGIIKTQTDHPEVLKWIGEFKTLVQAAATASEAPSDDFF